MSQMSLLWDLQSKEREFNEGIEKKSLKKKKKELLLLRKQYESIKEILEKKVEEYKALDSSIRKDNLKTKDLYYKIASAEKEMYSGSVNNTKVYEKMERELQELKKENQQLEDKIIYQLEEKESLEKEIRKMKKEMQKIKNMYKEGKDSYYKEIERIKLKQDKLNREIQQLEEKIEESYLKTYRKIAQNIQPAIAKVKNGTCLGCNMNLSIIFLKEIKNREKIHICENCGRMLYMDITS